MSILAAVAQITSVPSIATNTSVIVSLIRKAASRGAKIIFFPEASDLYVRPVGLNPMIHESPLGRNIPDSIAPAADVHTLAQSVEADAFRNAVLETARKENIWVNICVHRAVPNLVKCLNVNDVFSSSGELKGAYNKVTMARTYCSQSLKGSFQVHLFDVDLAPDGPTIRESNTTISGDSDQSPLIRNTPVGNIGVSIFPYTLNLPLIPSHQLQTCFDLRFPTPAVEMTSGPNAAHSIVYPSAFALHTGAAHWEVLLRARAIESQCYVFASAQVYVSHSFLYVTRLTILVKL